MNLTKLEKELMDISPKLSRNISYFVIGSALSVFFLYGFGYRIGQFFYYLVN